MLAQRIERFDELDEIIRTAIASRTLAEWEKDLRDLEISVGPVLTPREAVDDPLVRSLCMLGDEQTPSLTLPLQGLPTLRHAAAPELDADGAAVREHGWAALVDLTSEPAGDAR
jgi:crotonobetainyl-CoA:carnitine CoA-transferase CaiB-like acyl-CoA transferase